MHTLRLRINLLTSKLPKPQSHLRINPCHHAVTSHSQHQHQLLSANHQQFPIPAHLPLPRLRDTAPLSESKQGFNDSLYKHQKVYINPTIFPDFRSSSNTEIYISAATKRKVLHRKASLSVFEAPTCGQDSTVLQGQVESKYEEINFVRSYCSRREHYCLSILCVESHFALHTQTSSRQKSITINGRVQKAEAKKQNRKKKQASLRSPRNQWKHYGCTWNQSSPKIPSEPYGCTKSKVEGRSRYPKSYNPNFNPNCQASGRKPDDQRQPYT